MNPSKLDKILDKLIEEGLVTEQDDGFRLTEKGVEEAKRCNENEKGLL